MKAVVCEELGAPENLRYMDIPNPSLCSGQVLIDVKAVGVNFPDNLIIQGLYQEKPTLPFVPGMELSGVVAGVADDVTEFDVGDRVLSTTGTGAYCEQVAVEKHRCIGMPDSLDFNKAAALMCV